MVPASFDYGLYPPTPAVNPIPFFPSRLKDLKLDELKDAFEQIGTSKIPKKPLKRHYLNALRKDVRKIINSMPLNEQKEWLQRADIECDGYDPTQLGPLILGRVM